MRIVVLSDWFSEGMGYSENCLPKALAAMGPEVHLVTSNAQIYFDSAEYKQIYEPFIGPPVVRCEVKVSDGYTVHRLPWGRRGRELRLRGLFRRLYEISPDIVQAFDVYNQTTRELCWYKFFLGYKVFLESHRHASVFHPEERWTYASERRKYRLYAATTGRLVNAVTEKCYAISRDCADIVVKFYGLKPDKIVVCSLGVDTELFRRPVTEEARGKREKWRQRLGFSESDVVCIYTGRFSKEKGPQILAQAIELLAKQGKNFKGLFVGGGGDEDTKAIQACAGCVVRPFVPFAELPPFYWAADIGVWPRQESTSQLDAVACGLPIIISNRVTTRERIGGNGFDYNEGDPTDLARKIESLSDSALRWRLGEQGSRKIQEQFSWLRIAKGRIQDYEVAVMKGQGHGVK